MAAPVLANPRLPPDFDFDSKEPWAPDTLLIIPIESTQVLMPESAAILGVHAFLKMAKLPYTVREMHNAIYISPNEKLPVLKCGAYVVSELEGIVPLAQAKGVSLTQHLSVTERADLRAYMSLVHNVLGNAMLYLCWVEDDVYYKLTRPRFGSPYNFPLNGLLPWTTRTKIQAQLYALKWAQRKTTEVFSEVKTCLMALSERLGDSEYFFGSEPTELDALAFGYLFTMITTPLIGPDADQFGTLVKEQPNLVRFCQRLEREFFSNE